MNPKNPFETGKVVPIGFGHEVRRQQKHETGIDDTEQMMQSITEEAESLLRNRGNVPHEIRVRQSQKLQRRIDTIIVTLERSLGDERIRQLVDIHKQLGGIFFEK